MKTTSLLILLLLSTTILNAQISVVHGLFKSEIKPRTAPPPPLPAPYTESDTNAVKVNIWPSPAPADFNLQVETPYSEAIYVEVYDLTGRPVIRFQALNSVIHIFGSTLQPGLYVVRLKQGPFVDKTFKVIKVKG